MKENKEPIIILLVLFVIIGLAYSPFKDSIKNRQSNDPKTTTSSSVGKKETPTPAPTPNLGSSPNKVIAKDIKEIEKDLKDLSKDAQKEIATLKRSPYYNKVRMSNIYGLKGKDPSREYITLTTSLKETETVKITGWYFKSEVTGYYVTIGKASLLPFPFTKVESDVVLQQKDKAIITKGFSPIGISFRTNKCTGFFEENRTFYPSLARKCPLPKEEKLPTFSTTLNRQEECVKLIERIPRCTTKGNEYIRDLADTVPQSCKTYIKNQINYNTCVANHFDDTDFPGNEYRVYLNKFGPLWRTTHDKINLHDENGLIVDSISY